ncbi:WD repeat and FYVE domain-containing protein 3, partial [Hyalella azteca]|uniref:WD repeat and FYVE domain-containing protein 3 n=1 Tax=Hyalella azteca TaxID=294128 RepID=A0A979FHY2_HYAAZ
MNIMRKWWGAGGRPEDGLDGSQLLEQQHQQQRHLALGLMHLKKLFSEILHPAHPLSEDEREDKLYNMLPLFCKVFSNSSPTDLVEKFEDVLLFTQHVSKLMVTEIRRRASNQSTAAASCAIVRFLEMEGEEEGVDSIPSSGGWLLLNALNLLADGPPAIIEVMTVSSLPSTLVKCLYLFFDLPDPDSADSENANAESNLNKKSHSSPLHLPLDTSKTGGQQSALQSTASDASSCGAAIVPATTDRRLLLQKVFVQVMLRLCSHTGPAEELARKDDLSLLFSASTSGCPPHNCVWRRSAAEVLMAVSRHGLSQPVISYIHSKGCIALCVENMERTQDLSPLEIVEMLVAIFCFLKDSADCSQVLLDDFKSAQGYAFLVDFILRLEHESLASNSGMCSPAGDSSCSSGNSNAVTPASTLTNSEGTDALRNLVLLVASLCYCGHSQPRPSLHPSTALYTVPGFVLPTPSNKGCSVRNVAAFGVLQVVFCRASSATLAACVLDAISSIYHADPANYFILEPQATLSSFAETMHARPHHVQVKYLELVELVVFELNHVPCKELISLSLLLKAHHTSSPSTGESSASPACTPTRVSLVPSSACTPSRVSLVPSPACTPTRTNGAVGCAAAAGAAVVSRRLSSSSSIFTAELVGVSCALSLIDQLPGDDFTIFVDSKSVVQALRAYNSRHPIVWEILIGLVRLAGAGRAVSVCWVPGHVGVRGNERADEAAVNAASSDQAIHSDQVPCRDHYPIIKASIRHIWREQWLNVGENKLRAIKDCVRAWSSSYQKSRKMEVALCRLRIGHTRLTHRCASSGECAASVGDEKGEEVCVAALELLALLLGGSAGNACVFRE